MSNDERDYKQMDKLDAQGVPRPDGTPLGNLRHTLAVYDDTADDRLILTELPPVARTPGGVGSAILV